MRIVELMLTIVELVLFVVSIAECNEANERSSGNPARNLGIPLNIGILDVPSASNPDVGSSRYPLPSPAEFPYTSNGNRRRAPQEERGFPGNPRPVQSRRHSEFDATGGAPANPSQGHRLNEAGDNDKSEVEGRPEDNRRHLSSPSAGKSTEALRYDRNKNNKHPETAASGGPRLSSFQGQDRHDSQSTIRDRPPAFNHQHLNSSTKYESTGDFHDNPNENNKRSESDASGGQALNEHQHDHHSNAANRPPATNRQHLNSSHDKSTDDFYDNRNKNNRGRISDNRGASNYNANSGDSIMPSKPNQDIYQGRMLPQSSGQQSYYDSNSQGVRRAGQSGYQGNDEGISSRVDSFNGNVNAGGEGRPQVPGENAGYHSDDVNSKSRDDSGYRDRVDDNFDGNDDRSRSGFLQASNARSGSGSGFGDNRDVPRLEISSGYREDADDGGSDENNRKSITNLDGAAGRRPSAEGFPRGSGGRQGSTTERSTTTGDYEKAPARAHSRTTLRPGDSEAGCPLPRQPMGGRYDLGGCDSSCGKEPGDVVPNTSVLTYTCDNGFVRNGSAVSVCLNDSWYMPPACLRTCPPLESSSVDIACKLLGSKVACDAPMEPGTRATLACKTSYKIPLTEDPAYREITCLEEGVWDRTLFRCLPKCGTTIARGSTLVVNGFTAKVGVFPWHVGIYEKKSRHVYEQICAGTLINSNLVVSAAHCFYDESVNAPKPASRYYAAAGKHYRSWTREEDYAQKSQIDTINIAKRYIGARGNFAQDIALLEIKTPFELTDLVHPVCLDWDNVLEREHLQEGRYGKAVGWGKTSDGKPSEELQGINVPFVSFDQCVADVPEDFRGYITPDKFCAGYRNGSSLCEGDSGGGLCFESNGLWYLRGIVSVSPVRDYSCDYQSYTGFTYFSQFREWIRSAFLTT